MDKFEEINKFTRGLDKIGIKVTYVGNYPWIYLDTINGVKVKEKFEGNHGFTVFWLPVRRDRPIRISDITEVFKLIRKYCGVV